MCYAELGMESFRSSIEERVPIVILSNSSRVFMLLVEPEVPSKLAIYAGWRINRLFSVSILMARYLIALLVMTALKFVFARLQLLLVFRELVVWDL